jgi:rRNA-processing protein CGR1
MTSYTKRLETRKHQEAVKELERQLKEEKEAERKVRGILLSLWEFL